MLTPLKIIMAEIILASKREEFFETVRSILTACKSPPRRAKLSIIQAEQDYVRKFAKAEASLIIRINR
jgi:hypothetical protein